MSSSLSFLWAAGLMLVATFALLFRDLPLQVLGRTVKTLPDSRMLLFLAVLVPLLAGSLYGVLGNRHALEASGAASGSSAPHPTGAADIERMVRGLADRLAQHPEDAKGWAMLARSWKVMGRYGEAEQAFAKAGAFVDSDPDLLTEYADVAAMRNGGHLAGKPIALVKKALMLDPDHPTALWMAGTASYQRKDYAEARQSWERLLRVLPADSPDRAAIQSNLGEIRILVGDPAPVPLTPAAMVTSASHAGTIRGKVTLAPELAGQVGPEDAVFVFARPAHADGQGVAMPLAVLRARASDLPMEFLLDSTNAMDPERTLGKAGLVTVEARISRHGDAMPRPGDLFTVREQVRVGSRIELRIDRIKQGRASPGK